MSSQAKAQGNSVVGHYLLRSENWCSACMRSLLLHTVGLALGPSACSPLIWIPGNEFHPCFNPFVFAHWTLLLGLQFQGQKKALGLGAAEMSTFLLQFLMLLDCKCLWDRAPQLPVTSSRGYMRGSHYPMTSGKWLQFSYL